MTPPSALAKLARGCAWLVDGLVEALLGAMRRGRRPVPYRVVVGESEAVVLGPDGARLGRLAENPAAPFEPPDLPRRLAGRDVDVVIPDAWIFRRGLEPVAAQSRPFLDAFVRHQIERITPWRAEAVHHRILSDPLPADPARIAVSVVVVPKRLVGGWLARLDGLGLAVVRLRGQESGDTILVGSGAVPGVAALRRGVAWSLAGLAVATVLVCGLLEWQASAVSADVEEQNRVLDDRKVVLAKARLREGAGDDAATKLLKLRDARPLAVATIDALALAVPDSAYLQSLSIERDHVSIAGLSTDPSALVPALETSGRFADVAATSATTRTEAGDADRFAFTMRVLPQPAVPAARDARKAGP